MLERLRLPFAALALIAIVLLAYANSLAGEFVFDDQSSVVENTSIRSLWPPGAVLLPPAEAGICGRPFANLTMALNYALHGLDVRGYHVVNLSLHVISALILFGLVRRTIMLPALAGRFVAEATGIALAVAALWALHPVQTNTVSYISQRVEGLMGLSYLATLYSFLRYATSGSRRWAALAVTSCILGMASKEVMITAPVVVLLYDRTFLAGSMRSALRQRAYLHGLLASTWVFLGWLMLHAELAQRGIGFALGVSVFDYALSESRAVWTYLRLAVWPHPLVFDYGWAFLRRVTDAAPYLAVVVPLVLFSGFALWRRWACGFLGAWFFIILSPSSSIAPIIQQPIAESRLYLPLATVVTLTVVGLYLLHRRTLWVWAAVALVFATLTSRRNEDYRTPLALWTDTVAKRPENARAHNNLGSALLHAGQPAAAADHFTTALQIQPTYPEPRQNLGVSLLRLGRPAAAVTAFEAALALQPASASTLCNLGEALLALGRTTEAVSQYNAALRVDPGHAAAHNNLSVISLAAGRFAEARDHAETALRRQPDFPAAHYNLGNALVRAGQPAAAIAAYTSALRLQPDLIPARHNLGVALLQSGRAAEAATQFRAVLEVQPDHPGARRNLEQALQLLPR
jgi:tetratricopeptide (TPR) repeat protein